MHILVLLVSIGALFSPEVYGRCLPLPSGRAKFRLIHISLLGHSQCGVELEILDPLNQTWLKKGQKADFWSTEKKICGAKPGAIFTQFLIQECCDANYDWCTKQWVVSGSRREAKGKKISNY